MAHYLVQVAFTAEAWANMSRNPQDREQAVRPVAERLGGTLQCAYWSFGEYDIVAILDMPDNVSAAAFSVAGSAGGAIKAVKTTPLITMDEGIEVMKKAADIGYQPPST